MSDVTKLKPMVPKENDIVTQWYDRAIAARDPQLMIEVVQFITNEQHRLAAMLNVALAAFDAMNKGAMRDDPVPDNVRHFEFGGV